MVPALIISLAGQDSQAILGFALSILVILAVAGVFMFFARKAKKAFMQEKVWFVSDSHGS